MLAVLGLLTPLLRTIANVAALGGHDACSQLLSTPACTSYTPCQLVLVNHDTCKQALPQESFYSCITHMQDNLK